MDFIDTEICPGKFASLCLAKICFQHDGLANLIGFNKSFAFDIFI